MGNDGWSLTLKVVDKAPTGERLTNLEDTAADHNADTEYQKDGESGIVTTTLTDEIASKDNSLTTASDPIISEAIESLHQEKHSHPGDMVR